MSIIKLNNQTILDALKKAKPGDTIVLEPKVYREKVIVDVDNITILGDKSGKSVIAFDDYAKKIHADGQEYNTFRTYTVNVIANSVTLKNLTIVNDALFPQTKGQAVALSVCGKDFLAKNLKLCSMQDTLFCGPLPDDLVVRYQGFLKDNERYFEGQSTQIYLNCHILGSVDYVFGTARAFFKGCTFTNVNDGRDTAYVCAPAHSLKQDVGFTFINCSFDCESDVTKNSTFLARPWRDFGKATFINCRYSHHIKNTVFDKWNDTTRDKTARFELYPKLKGFETVSWHKPITKAKTLEYKAEFTQALNKLKNK